jgi:hypothetical protein
MCRRGLLFVVFLKSEKSLLIRLSYAGAAGD